MRLFLSCIGPLAILVAVAIAVGDRPRATSPQPIAVSAPQPLSAAELAAAPAAIDQLIDAALKRLGVAPNPLASEAAFLRRTTLTVIGRNPTLAESAAFAADPASTRRDALIERLLASEARVLGEFSWWADLLRVQTRLQDRYPGQNWIDWLKDALRQNLPYDRLVREMLTAEGPALAGGNGATGFWVRDIGMPLDHVSTTTEEFLATQIGCAQCHDHPYEDWTRKQFFQFAAFTASSDARKAPPGGKPAAKALKQAAKELTQLERQALQRLGETLGLRVNGTVVSHLALPDDYQYDDAKPKDRVEAAVLFGEPVAVRKGQDPRAAVAGWIASADNPLFVRAIVNRRWQRLFGQGLIEPLSNLTAASPIADAELLTMLERVLVSLKFDLRAFDGVLLRTTHWARATVQSDPAPGAATLGGGPLGRRLTAEQMWDSLMMLAVPGLDSLRGDNAEALSKLYDAKKDMTVDQILAEVKAVAARRERQQAIRTRLGEIRAAMSKTRGPALAALRDEQRALNTERERLSSEMEGQQLLARGKNKSEERLLRAAELTQPAPAGHFLRVFGQSDRELINNGIAAPNVTQALLLLNGPYTARLAAPTAPLQVALIAAGTDTVRVQTLYRALLGREPSAAESTLAESWLHEHPGEGLADLTWALINSSEFRYLP